MEKLAKKKINHYKTIAQVIEYIVATKSELKSLEELSLSLGISPGHLQKVFTEWVGISPKQFGRYISLQYSKELLAQNKTTLQTAYGAGLSGSGRLHDLFVDIEAMTPGEYHNGGENLKIDYSVFETKFGPCLVASTNRGICNILFADTKRELVDDLRSRWSRTILLQCSQPSHAAVSTYFDNLSNSSKGLTKKSKIKLHLHGTNFQLKVWEALLSIPEGSISSYGTIAQSLGDKNLSRQVGAAVGDNPIGYIIPCHRVLKSTGEISGYRWGIHRKRAMLGFEAIRKQRKNMIQNSNGKPTT